jgi:predicted nucleic acid-binding protein
VIARVAYLDASALVKLAVKEPESRALGAYLATMEHRVSSRVSVVELLRAATRHGPRARARVAAVLEALEFIELDRELAATAGTIQPSLLRSLDAIHLASAAAMASSLAAVVTYDARLSDAARSLGLPVAAPS